MGIAVSGVIFAPITNFDVSVLNRAFALNLQKIEGKLHLLRNPTFDPRNRGDFIVHFRRSHICIMNTDVADDLLFKNDFTSYHLLSSAFPTIERMIFFCLYDSGGSYGYSAFAHGELLRRKVYTVHGGTLKMALRFPSKKNGNRPF
ncbi:hypothetical protein [Rhizobium sp. BR 362]|uniref:hypothetical protein n=1 Tax=Rhizobium sp. BR 362 TaxID=3040670 RepID=UPI002F40B400